MESSSFSYKLIAFLSGFSGFTAYAVILGVLLACGLGVPIPEDITLVSAGVLAALGKISILGAMIAGLVGVLIGDTFLFFLGRFYGYKVFKLRLFRSVFTEDRIEKAKEKIVSNSRFICFAARFLPGLRAPIYLTAGIMGVKPIVFFTLDGLAALISVPVWVYVGYIFGNNLDKVLEVAMEVQGFIIAAVVLLIAGYFIWKKRKKRATT